MKKDASLLVLLFCILASNAWSQQNEELIRVKTGTGLDILKSFPKDKRFRFSSFQAATVHLSNKKIQNVNLANYDLLTANMVMINNNGDTIAFKDLKEIKSFDIGTVTLIHIYEKGYFEVINECDSVELCFQELYKLKRRERHLNNGYGGDSNDQTSMYSSTKPLSPGLRQVVNSDIIVQKHYVYYLLDRTNEAYATNKSSLIKLFPTRKTEIIHYVDTYHPDFKLKGNLESLFKYCTQ